MPTMKSRAKRAAVAAVAAALTVTGLAGCQIGFDEPTLMQYTAAEGINVDITEGEEVEQGTGMIKVRNLLVVAPPEGGEGNLAGTIFASDSLSPGATPRGGQVDSLESATGRALDGAGNPLGDIEVQVDGPVEFSIAEPAKLEEQNITVTGEGIRPGIDVELTLTFAENGSITTLVPVVDASKPDFETMEAQPGTAQDTPAPEGEEETPAPEGDAPADGN